MRPGENSWARKSRIDAAQWADAIAPTGVEAMWAHTGISKSSARSAIFFACSNPPALGISGCTIWQPEFWTKGRNPRFRYRFSPVRIGTGDSAVSLDHDSE